MKSQTVLCMMIMFLCSCAPMDKTPEVVAPVRDPEKTLVGRERGILLYKSYNNDYPEYHSEPMGTGHVRLLKSGDIVNINMYLRLMHLIDTLKPNDTIFLYRWADSALTWTNIR